MRCLQKAFDLDSDSVFEETQLSAGGNRCKDEQGKIEALPCMCFAGDTHVRMNVRVSGWQVPERQAAPNFLRKEVTRLDAIAIDKSSSSQLRLLGWRPRLSACFGRRWRSPRRFGRTRKKMTASEQLAVTNFNGVA